MLLLVCAGNSCHQHVKTMGLLVVHLIQLMLLLSMLLVMLLLLLLLGQSFSSRVGISFESKSSRELVTEFVIIKL